MNRNLRFIAIGYAVVFFTIPFVLSRIIDTDLQGFIITFMVFVTFGVGGSLWIINYDKKLDEEQN
jgi:ABC-type transport system involved in multi-copper enzyme maturation permease subunit